MTSAPMQLVEQARVAYEEETGHRVLLATTFGRRAYGYPGSDTPARVRFITLAPPSVYLASTIANVFPEANRPSVIGETHGIHYLVREDGPPIEFVGTDIVKVLNLLILRNPVIYEWLHVDHTLIELPMGTKLREMVEQYWDRRVAYKYYGKELLGIKSENALGRLLGILRYGLMRRWIGLFEEPPSPSLKMLMGLLSDPEQETVSTALAVLAEHSEDQPLTATDSLRDIVAGLMEGDMPGGNAMVPPTVETGSKMLMACLDEMFLTGGIA